jgi:hypothetical protein
MIFEIMILDRASRAEGLGGVFSTFVCCPLTAVTLSSRLIFQAVVTEARQIDRWFTRVETSSAVSTRSE